MLEDYFFGWTLDQFLTKMWVVHNGACVFNTIGGSIEH